MKNSEWNIREAIASDLPFIYNSWLESYRYTSYLVKRCRNQIFFPQYTKVIDRILSQKDTKILVACHLEHRETLFSYLVYQPKTLHYAYTKSDFWRQGLGKCLWEEAGKIKYFSHLTTSVSDILFERKDAEHFIYNPFILFKQTGEDDGS